MQNSAPRLAQAKTTIGGMMVMMEVGRSDSGHRRYFSSLLDFGKRPKKGFPLLGLSGKPCFDGRSKRIFCKGRRISGGPFKENAMMRFTRPLILLALLALTACASAAEEPPPAITVEVPTSTPPPTAVPPTLAPTVTALPPTATPTAEPTATLEPTATAEPTATPTPGPGSLLLAADFTQLSDWTESAVPESSRYTFETREERLRVTVKGEGLTAYLTYNTDLGYADIQIDADIETIDGPNRNNVSLVCRASDDGWYEFSMYSNGLWEIWKYNGRYHSLASGGSTAIHMQKAKNHLTAVCEGSTLTFFINDVKVGSTRDNEFATGQVGLSVSAFNIPGVVVEFAAFEVTRPDPANPPGLAVAPTVPPSTSGSGAGGGTSGGAPSLPTVPVPGQTLADYQLQGITLDFIVIYEEAASPNCQTRRMVNTEVTAITQEFQFENNVLVAGAWIERWTIDSCGVVTAYKVTYTADGSGGTYFSINKL
jgi:hypothetical protein